MTVTEIEGAAAIDAVRTQAKGTAWLLADRLLLSGENACYSPEIDTRLRLLQARTLGDFASRNRALSGAKGQVSAFTDPGEGPGVESRSG